MVTSSRSSQNFIWYHSTFLICSRNHKKIADMLKRTEVKALHLKSVLVAFYSHLWKRHNLIQNLLLNNIFHFCFLIFLDATESYLFESPSGNRKLIRKEENWTTLLESRPVKFFDVVVVFAAVKPWRVAVTIKCRLVSWEKRQEDTEAFVSL